MRSNSSRSPIRHWLGRGGSGSIRPSGPAPRGKVPAWPGARPGRPGRSAAEERQMAGLCGWSHQARSLAASGRSTWAAPLGRPAIQDERVTVVGYSHGGWVVVAMRPHRAGQGAATAATRAPGPAARSAGTRPTPQAAANLVPARQVETETAAMWRKPTASAWMRVLCSSRAFSRGRRPAEDYRINSPPSSHATAVISPRPVAGFRFFCDTQVTPEGVRGSICRRF